MTETEQRPQVAVVPVSAGHLAAAGLIAERAQDALAQLQAENEHLKSALERVRALAQSWAALAPADDWGESMAGTAAADCGRLILSVTDTAVAGAGGAEAELASLRERVLAGAEARKTTLTWPDADTVGKIDVIPVSALRTLLGPGAGDLAGFWLTVDGEGGEIIMSAPCVETLGCLWSHHASIERVTLGELLAAASTHTGIRAGRLHATLAPAEGEGARAAEMNDGRPVVWCSAVPPGGWVCAVPMQGHGQEGICGMPVESEPCGEHGKAGQVAAGTCGQCEDGLIPIGRCNCGSPADASIGYMHERLCGFEPCPNGCWDRLHPATAAASGTERAGDGSGQ